MKKLSLKNLKLEASDMLERHQLKTVFGGYSHLEDGQGCSVTCQSGYYACCKESGILADRCKCVSEGESSSCDHGGVGASSCSWSE